MYTLEGFGRCLYLLEKNAMIEKQPILQPCFFAGTLITACGSSSKVTSRLSDGDDSIKVEVSTKVSTNYGSVEN